MDLNKVTLLGNLIADPEATGSAKGTTFVLMRLATSNGWRDSASKERKQETVVHTVVLFRRLGEIASKYLRKGDRLLVEGRLSSVSAASKSDAKRRDYRVVASNVIMLGAKGGRNQAAVEAANVKDKESGEAAEATEPDQN